MNRLVLFLLLFVALQPVRSEEMAKRNKKEVVPSSWTEAVMQAKQEVLGELQKSAMPVERTIKYGQKEATSVSIDLKGMKELTVYCFNNNDGGSSNPVVWQNPQLVTADGKKIDLVELQSRIRSFGRGEVQFGLAKLNENTMGKTSEIKTVEARPDCGVVIPVDRKYVRFEAGFLADRNTKSGSLTIRFLNVDPQQQVDQLNKRFASQLAWLAPYANLTRMLLSSDTDEEQKAAQQMVERLTDKSYFTAAMQKATAQTNPVLRSEALLKLFAEARQVARLQEELVWLNIPAMEASIAHLKKDKQLSKNYDFAVNEAKLAELKKLAQPGFSGIYTYDAAALQAARKALDLKREIMLSNPLLDVDKLIVGRYTIGSRARSANAPYLGTPPNNWSNQTSASKSGFDASIAELSNLRGTPRVRTIFKPENGSSVPDLKLHWDANRILFSMIEPGDHHWQVYEVGVDGNNLRQLTHGSSEDLDYIDACYLPNGKIVAASNVGGQGVPCVSGGDEVGNLCLIDPEKNSMRRLTFDQDANWNPTMMHNGRVMYVRWEYTDLTHYFSRIVMHMNPDGTEQRSLYGSGSVFPNSTFDVQPLPDHPTRFVGVISGHHGVARSGRLMIFDPAKSRKEEKGMVQEIPFSKRPIVPLVKDELVNDVWPQFLKPQPLNNDYFVVSAKLSPDALWGLYLVDIFDNVTPIASFEGEGLIYGIPLKSTTKPPVIPEKVNLNSKEATVFIQDLYEGEGLPGVPRGTVKELRVFAYEYAYVRSPSDHTAQGIQSGWDIKRLLGTVPVEEDGSVMFKIPANTPISLQPLDSEGRAIQWMRSWLTGQPGETVSCVGCHEDQNQIPMPKRVIASGKQPQALKAPQGGVRSFTFVNEIQPILDRTCIACHNEKSKIDLRGEPMDEPTGFHKSYLAIHPYVHRQGPEAGMKVLFPYEYHASNSVLVKMLKDGHYGVNLTNDEWKALYNWIDFNVPDKGYFVAKDWGTGDQFSRRIEMNKKYANGIYVDWQQELKDYAQTLKGKDKPSQTKPPYQAPVFKEVTVKGFPFNGKEYLDKTLKQQERKTVEIAPGVNITFVRIPAGEFVMGKNQKNSNYAPAFKAAVKKAFWMSEKEITNEQMLALVPTHESRFMDQQWKDHVNEGYPAYLPGQPASRVGWYDANQFCKKLSDKTGQNVLLPTETQWEWACRAGSSEDFWYGSLNTDFGKFENMADKQLNKMAVIGVDPQPMRPDNFWYKYYTFIPKMEGVDDGHMLVSDPGSYQANAWGLYDMHGNVAEWTRSDYLPYPLSEKQSATNSQKVVRGGSWKEHPKYSTAAYRKYYLPEQKPYNVGFRVVIEE